ncbi:MAG TPA: ABC transporter substrate-binding protein, partial [Pseudonocardiaceae bacterium]|nr:ABC transporter substrate-binding protein [Pseudonocardiaceae bacterium]
MGEMAMFGGATALRTVLVVGSALMLVACGGGGGGSSPSGSSNSAALDGRGDITFVTGKDTSGNMQKLVDKWNSEHQKEQVRIVELPESADAARQQMVQNAQVRSDTYTVLNLDVVWTAEFAA